MNINQLLKQGDPIDGEPPPADGDLQRMRRLVMMAVLEPPRAAWPQPIFVAATLAGAIATSVVVGRQLPRPQTRQTAAPVTPILSSVSEPVTRQLQFETPGGTRIIWVFDPEFKL